ncbi:hypothetical protein VNO78_21114 [Psophocarpus tetragonolobus]|uniref:Uncharacterized protein n=1 Tax=Psophocarpus tetragonolobus TaxID=3891 RepID=A0AAN9SBI1_PSOTE
MPLQVVSSLQLYSLPSKRILQCVSLSSQSVLFPKQYVLMTMLQLAATIFFGGNLDTSLIILAILPIDCGISIRGPFS